MRPINCQIYTDRLIYAVYKNLFPYYVLNVIHVDKLKSRLILNERFVDWKNNEYIWSVCTSFSKNMTHAGFQTIINKRVKLKSEN